MTKFFQGLIQPRTFGTVSNIFLKILKNFTHAPHDIDPPAANSGGTPPARARSKTPPAAQNRSFRRPSALQPEGHPPLPQCLQRKLEVGVAKEVADHTILRSKRVTFTPRSSVASSSAGWPATSSLSLPFFPNAGDSNLVTFTCRSTSSVVVINE